MNVAVAVVEDGEVDVDVGNVDIGVAEAVPGPGVAVGGIVGVDVGCCTTGAFNNGSNKPTVTPSFVNVVLFEKEL